MKGPLISEVAATVMVAKEENFLLVSVEDAVGMEVVAEVEETEAQVTRQALHVVQKVPSDGRETQPKKVTGVRATCRMDRLSLPLPLSALNPRSKHWRTF